MNDLIDVFKTTGEIFYGDQNILGNKIDVINLRRKIGMIFQKPNPFPMSIYENIAYGPKLQGLTDKKKIDHIVEKCLVSASLWEEVKNRLNESALGLSGGQQQRLCIARALAIEPDVILMDEPTASLDPIATAHIEDLIAELKRKFTVIIVTHNMQQAMRVSDYTGFLYMGKMIEFDTTEKIFDAPNEELTKNYISGQFG
jgi:phosphate transport system ATP-binding protein